MKTILIFASSINGYIAESDNSTHWSDEEWEEYRKNTHEIGNMIVGRKTYELMVKFGEIDALGLRNLVIVSRKNIDSLYHTEHSPEEALQYLESLGEKKVIICGGSSIATYLLEHNLLDEIILDIDPVIISGGIPIF